MSQNIRLGLVRSRQTRVGSSPPQVLSVVIEGLDAKEALQVIHDVHRVIPELLPIDEDEL